MQRLAAFLVVVVALCGCATSQSRWEIAALGAALADIGSTGAGLENGGREVNPVYGENPSVERILAVNLALHAGIFYTSRDADPAARQKIWRNVTILRLLVAGWNLSQSRCACLRFSF